MGLLTNEKIFLVGNICQKIAITFGSNQNGKILREPVKFVKEQRQINRNQQKMITVFRKDSQKMVEYFERRLKLHYALVQEQRERLKNHEVRLKTLKGK